MLCDSTTMRKGGEVMGKQESGTKAEQSLSSTLHTLQTDVHTSVASSGLNCFLLLKYMDSSISPKDENWFPCRCHHTVIALCISVGHCL